MIKYLAMAGMMILVVIGVATASAQPPPDDGCAGGETLFQEECIPNSTHFDICHVAGLASDPANYVDLNIPIVAIVGPAGHFNENGTPNAGHENDSFGVCEPPDPPAVEVFAGVTADQPDCENQGVAALLFERLDAIDYDVEGTVAPGQTVQITATAKTLLGFLLIGQSEFEVTFDSFDAESCDEEPPPPDDDPDDPDDGGDETSNPPVVVPSTSNTTPSGDLPESL